MNRQLVHASLFSGIGGAEVAAEMIGWRTAFWCEIAPFQRRVLKYWFPKAIGYENIITTNFREWQGKVDVLTGGFPCQPFSNAGKRRGAEDGRYLWPEMARAIHEIKPTWVIVENVAGFGTMVEQPTVLPLGEQGSLFGESGTVRGYRQRSTFTIERVRRDIESEGYEVIAFMLPAISVGAPHKRDRYFLVAHTHGNDGMRGPGIGSTAQEEKRLQGGDELYIAKESVTVQSCSADTHSVTDQSPTARKRTKICRRNHDVKPGERRYTPQRTARLLRLLRVEPGGRKPRIGRTTDYGLASRWKHWASQSAFCGRNDGLPFDVDDLTISFSRWAEESTKSFGNAIVPQVLYEVFKAIDNIENNG